MRVRAGVAIYRFDDGRIVVAPETVTGDGLWVVTKPFIQVDESELPEKKGMAVLESIARSESSVASKATRAAPGELDALLAFAEVGTWVTLVRQATSCSLEETKERFGKKRLWIYGSIRKFDNGCGYEHLDQIEVLDQSPDKVGELLEKVLQTCE